MKTIACVMLSLLLVASLGMVEAPRNAALAADEMPVSPAPTRVSVLAAGDLMCLYAQLGAAKTAAGYQFDQCFYGIRQRVSSADLAIANLETLVASGYPYTGRKPRSGYTRINAPDSFLSAVKSCGFDVLTTANNHTYDYKADGIVKTMKKLDQFGLFHTGAYAAQTDKKPLICDVKGVRIGIVAYTDVLNNRPSGADAHMIDIYSESRVSADIASARKGGADFVIVYMHWGRENTHKITGRQQTAARFIANAGADMILGSHSHCVQPFAYIKTARGNVPVIYSMGNLVSSMSRSINKDGVLVTIVLEKNPDTGVTKIVKMTYLPTFCTTTSAGKFVVMPASAAAAASSKALKSSRARTLKVLGSHVAQPE